MASLGSLVVELAVDTAKFQGDLGRAAAIAESRMKNIKDSATRAFGALTVAASAAGAALVAALAGGLERADAINKLSQSTGIAAENLSKLEFAANQAGVQNDAFAISLKKLNVNISAAAGGSSDALAAFESMGVAIKDAGGNTRATGDVLKDVANKFATYKDGADKTALAVELFGKAGQELIPLLNGGAAGLKELGDQAQRAGLVVGTDAAQSAEELNDKLTLLKRTFTEGFGNRLTAELLPALTKISDSFTKTAQGASSLDEFVRVAATSLKILASIGNVVATTFEVLGKNIGASVAAFVQLAQGNFRQAFNIIKDDVVDSIDTIKASVNRFSLIWSNEANQVEAQAPALGGKLAAPSVEAAKRNRQELEKMRRDIAAFGPSLSALISSGAEEFAKGGDSIRTVFDDLGNPMNVVIKGNREIESSFHAAREAALSDLDKIREQYDANSRALEEYAQAHPEAFMQVETLLIKLGERYKEQTEILKESTTQVTEYAKAAAQGIQGALADFLFDPFDKGIKGMLVGFINVIRRMIAEALAAQLAEKLFGKTGTSGVLGGAVTSFLGAIFGGGKAAGGPLEQGKWYVAGERGPEPIWGGGPGAFAAGYPKQNAQPVTVNVSVDARGSTQDAIKMLPSAIDIAVQKAVARMTQYVTRGAFS